MTELRFALFAFLAFLLPVGMYCFVLAAINRRARPLIVRGSWDAIGLVCAVSGFFLATVPVLASQFTRHVLGATDLAFGMWAWWLVYYLLILAGAVLMVLSRSKKTVIYNIDPELFATIAQQTFAALGLATKMDRNRLTLTPLVPDTTAEASTAVTETRPHTATASTDRRYAELSIESFAAMCNVTLHWGPCSADLRDALERELDKNLESAAPLDNSASAWFVSISGMIFGAVLVMFIVMTLLHWR